MPPYLIALAVGDIAFQAIGPRTGGLHGAVRCWIAPPHEFVDLEKMVDAAEVAARSLPLGPLRPAGAAAVVSLRRDGEPAADLRDADHHRGRPIARLARRARAGALVVRQPGDQRHLERLLAERRVHDLPRERASWKRSTARSAPTCCRVLGRRDLDADIARLGGPSSRDTILHIDLAGRDPDEGATDIPYEKGALFLQTIEAAVGRERFDAFLRSYFDRYAFQSITSAVFLDDVREEPRGAATRSSNAGCSSTSGSTSPVCRPTPSPSRHAALDRVEAQARRSPAARPQASLGRAHLEHAGVAALPRQPARQADRRAAAGSRSHVSPDRQRQQRDPVLVAADCASATTTGPRSPRSSGS